MTGHPAWVHDDLPLVLRSTCKNLQSPLECSCLTLSDPLSTGELKGTDCPVGNRQTLALIGLHFQKTYILPVLYPQETC